MRRKSSGLMRNTPCESVQYAVTGCTLPAMLLVLISAYVGMASDSVSFGVNCDRSTPLEVARCLAGLAVVADEVLQVVEVVIVCAGGCLLLIKFPLVVVGGAIPGGSAIWRLVLGSRCSMRNIMLVLRLLERCCCCCC